jgi:hypothetical protein
MRPTYSFIIECIRLVNNEKSGVAVACLPAKKIQAFKCDELIHFLAP